MLAHIFVKLRQATLHVAELHDIVGDFIICTIALAWWLDRPPLLSWAPLHPSNFATNADSTGSTTIDGRMENLNLLAVGFHTHH